MKLKKYALILLAVVALTIAAIAVPALATLEEPVVYLDGDTTDTVRDGSFDHPCKTLAEAYAALGSTGGTIVLCDDYTIDTDDWTVNNTYGYHLKFPVTTNKVTITGKDDTTDYGATLYVDPDNSNSVRKKAHFLIYSPLEFSHLTLDHKKASYCMEIYSGPELTFGEGMEMKVNGSTLTANDDIGVRLGYFSFPSGSGLSASNANCSVTMKSGSVSYLQGGNDKVGINSSSITLEGGAEVLGTLQCGGTRKSVNTSSVTINGAKVNELYLGGYSDSNGTASLASVTLTAVNAEITKLCGGRSDNGVATTVSGDVKVTFDDTTVGTTDVSLLTVNGNKELILRNGDYSSLTTTGWTVADYTDWATVYVDSGYTGGNSDGTVEKPFTDINSAIDAVNKAYGADSTVPGGLILLAGDLTTITGEDYTLTECDVPLYVTSINAADRQTIFFGDSSGKNFVYCTTPITFEDVIFRLGGNANGEIWTGESLTIGDNVTFYLQDGVTEPNDTSNGRVSIRTGGKSYLAEARLEMNSGSVSLIQGGNSNATVGHATLILNEGVNVSWFVQCGGTGQKNGYDVDGNLLENGGTDLQINGATINILYLNGHGTSHNNIVNAVVQDATVNTIAYNRSGAAATTQELNLTLDNATVGSLCSLGDEVTTSSLTLLPSEDAYATLTAGITGWEKTAPVLLDTVYVKGTGDNANDGSDENNAVATLQKAYDLVKDGGTIVLCGNLDIMENGSIYRMPEKAVTITGLNYNPVLTFDNSSNEKLHVQFKKATTLENITINRGAKMAGYPRCLELWTGPSLTVGEGVSFTNNGAALSRHSDGQVVVRVGDRTMANTAALPNGEYTQKSGTLSFIQSGNNYHEVTSTTVNLSGTAVVLDNIQCGGTNKKVGTSEVNISGSVQIGDLYVNGYGSASLDSVTINITGGTINNLRAGRSRAQYNDANNAESTGTLGNVTVTIGGTAKVKEIDFWDQNTMTFTGTKKLVMKALAEEFTYNGSFGQWDEVSIEEASAVCYSGTYVAPKSKLVIKDTSKLIVNTCTNNPNNITADEGTGTVTGRHLINYVEAKEVSIAYPGELAHYACPSCGKIYRDADGVNEITDRESIRTYWQCHTDNGSLTGTGDDFSTEMMFTISGGQGIAISGDYMFQCDGSGNCYVYNMLTGRRIGSFKLGSYNNGSIASFESEDWVSDEDRQRYAELQQQLDAAKANGASENELKAIQDKMATIRADYQNHANQIMFSSYYYKDTDVFPLLYVTAGNEGAYGKYGYRGHCAVERIVYDEETGIWSAQCLQRIFFDDRGYETAEINQNNFAFTYQNNTNTGFVNTNGYEKIGWGWPASFVDSDPSNSVTKDKFYLYSARYRTTTSWESSWANTYAQNGFDNFNYADHSAYIITEFNMPAPPSEGGQYDARVVLTPLDIQDQFTTEYRSYVTQGGTMYQGRIYYSYGWNGAYGTAHADSLQVFDIASKKIISRLDLGEDRNGIGHCEPECVAVWNGKIVMSCNGSNPVPSGLWIFGHIELHGETKPTCTEDGTHYTYCSYCGEHLSDTVKVEDKLDHSFTNYVSNNDATCTEDGTKTAVCDRDGCNEKDTVVDTGSKLDHSFTDYKSNGDATCTADGTKTAKCDRCDETDTVKEAAHGHKLTKVAGKAATCTEEGVVEHYTCSVCKKNFSDAEGKTALSTIVIPSCHSVEKVEGKAATTTENGLKEHYGCASCGKVYADAEGKTEVTKDSLIISATSAPTDTGDDFRAWPFILLMVLSVAGVTVLVVGKKQWFRKNK